MGAASSRSSRLNRLVLWGGVTMVVFVTFGHYLTPSSSPQFHDALRRLYYLPIVLVGVRCGLTAGLGVAGLSVLTYFPHIWTHWGGDPLGPENLNRSFEMVMWLSVGAIAGVLAQREQAARMAAEEARDAAQASAREAREAARSLLEAEDRLRRADRMATLGFLSASLAHEVRNPLGSLKGIADMLRGDFPEGHPRRELVDILDEEVRRLDGVVANYLEQARPRPGAGPAPVGEAADGVFRLLRAELSKTGIAARVEVTPDDLAAPLPADLLRQALINLVLNSMHAIGNDGGQVTIMGRANDGTVELVVEDDGPGFPAELVDDEPHSFLAPRRFGSGLGLPIVHQIVDSHGGALTLENRPGCGARVVIRFGNGS